MTNQNANLRFVHVQEDIGNYNGMTVAYERTEDNVFFSFAMCCKPDQYSKAEGRKFSTATYLNALDEIHYGISYVDFSKRIGCMSRIDVLGVVIECTDVDSVIGDHVIRRLSLMDLKHAFISNALVSFIKSHSEAKQNED